jgi:hypothetical protein
MAGLVWRLNCGDAGHALVCLVISIFAAVWATIWDAGCGEKWGWDGGGFEMIRKWQGKMLVF